MYLKVWKIRLYVKVQGRIVKRQGKTRHAHELARTAKVASWIYEQSDTALVFRQINNG